MKAKLFLVSLLVFPFFLQAQIFNDAMRVVKSGNPNLTEQDAAAGIREALVKGTGVSVDLVSRIDGYLGNKEIRIPFPEDARTIETTLRNMGLNQQIDDVVVSLNRAAEDAAKEAQPIFVSAIKSMTVTDAINIVRGSNDAATQYLSRTTSPELRAKFAPIIKISLDRVNATKLWSDVIRTYNQVPFVNKMNPDLVAYVTQKAIQGLFVMIAKEETKIRQNPAERTSEILQKVFGK